MNVNEELNTALYKKMFAEQETFRDWLKSQPPEEILKHTYEYAVREDILMALEYNDLDSAQARMLLSSPTPLQDVFTEFEKRETGYMDVVRDSIEAVAGAEARKLRELPVYRYPAAHARENNELELYRASNKANTVCKEAIEKAISEHYYDNVLHQEAVVQVAEQFGYERTLYVLAITIRQKDWDGRFSNDNKAWAMTVPVMENPDAWGTDRNCYLAVNSHSGLVDLFTKLTREEAKAHERKPSVIEKLKNRPPEAAKEVIKKAKEPSL